MKEEHCSRSWRQRRLPVQENPRTYVRGNYYRSLNNLCFIELRNYMDHKIEKSYSGNSRVFSFTTACKACGFSPRTRRIVGAICVVCTGVLITCGRNPGPARSNATLRSCLWNPPCSARNLVSASI